MTAALLPVVAAPTAAGAAPSVDGPWRKVNGKPAATKSGRPAAIKAKRLSAFTLDRAGIKNVLDKAPTENRRALHQAKQVVSLPTPEGTHRATRWSSRR